MQILFVSVRGEGLIFFSLEKKKLIRLKEAEGIRCSVMVFYERTEREISNFFSFLFRALSKEQKMKTLS